MISTILATVLTTFVSDYPQVQAKKKKTTLYARMPKDRLSSSLSLPLVKLGRAMILSISCLALMGTIHMVTMSSWPG